MVRAEHQAAWARELQPREGTDGVRVAWGPQASPWGRGAWAGAEAEISGGTWGTGLAREAALGRVTGSCVHVSRTSSCLRALPGSPACRCPTGLKSYDHLWQRPLRGDGHNHTGFLPLPSPTSRAPRGWAQEQAFGTPPWPLFLGHPAHRSPSLYRINPGNRRGLHQWLGGHSFCHV